jgi:endogenous inhibitor of DNA gyrase (YacG/DUF329 family)
LSAFSATVVDMAEDTCKNEDGNPVFSGGFCRRCYNGDLAERKARGEVIRRGPAATQSREVPCARCGEDVKVTGKRLAAAEAGRPIYCSHGCQSVSARVELPCTGCGTTVWRYRSTLTTDPDVAPVRVFCEECRAGGANMKPRRGTTKPCAICEKPVYRGPSHDPDKPRYCSDPCRAVGISGERVERIERPCEVCGTTMRLTPQQRRLDVRTCSRECTAANRRAKPGERYVDDQGYVWITSPDGRRMFEHRYAMEQHLGRELLPTETVHHKTGGFAGRSNNLIRNLELWTGRHPKGHRVEDVVAYCREMLAVYGNSAEQAMYAEQAPAVYGDKRSAGSDD